MPLRLSLVLAMLTGFAGCRSVSTDFTPGAIWQTGAPVLVVPQRADTFDVDIAATIAQRLDQLGMVHVLPTPPSASPVAASDAEACQLGRATGARYVVTVATRVSVQRVDECQLSTGVFHKLFIPIPVFSPLLGKPRSVEIAKVPLADGDGCLLTKTTWDWVKAADAHAIDMATCTNTGNHLSAGAVRTEDASEPSHDINDLIGWVRAATPDLFPSQADVREVRDGGAVASPSRGISTGEVYEVRHANLPGGRPMLDELAYVRGVDGDRVSVEPYGSAIDVAPGDVLIRRGRVQWVELVPFAAASMLAVGDQHAPLVGGGGRLRVDFRGFMFGIAGEYLANRDDAMVAAMGRSGLFNFGAEMGAVRHVARRIDLYGLVSGGATLADQAPGGDAGAGGYAGIALGGKLTLGRLFLDAELGGIYSSSYTNGGGVDVHQRGPFARIGLGLNVWPRPIGQL